MVRTLCFEDLHVGMRETLMKSVMDTDVVGFAQFSGDDNPIHLCDDLWQPAPASASASRTASTPQA